MKNRIFFIISELILFLVFMYLLVINYMTGTKSGLNITIGTDSFVELNTFFVILAIYVIGVVSGIVYSLSHGQKYKDLVEFYARKNEKLSQQNEIDSDDKEALQRKIASLEIALNNALKNKQN